MPSVKASSAMRKSWRAKVSQFLLASLINDFTLSGNFFADERPLVRQSLELLRGIHQNIHADLWTQQFKDAARTIEERLLHFFDNDQIDIGPFINLINR